MFGSARERRTPAQALLLALVRGESVDDWDANDLVSPGASAARGASWADALGLAAIHGVAPLLHELAQTGALPGLPEMARKELRASRIAELMREEKRARVLRDALAVLAGKAGARPIPTLLLKGAASARTLYAAPELRPRSDLDLLILPADREEALERFQASGYVQHEKTRGTREDEPDWHERTLVDPRDPAQQIDVHFALAQPERHRLDARTLFAASAPVTVEPALGAVARILPAEEAALVCAHALAIHELTAPLISLCDLARLLSRCDLLRLLKIARDAQLVRALYAATALLAQLGPPALTSENPCASYSLCGARVEAPRLAMIFAGANLSRPVRHALRRAAAGYDLARAPLARPRQLWRKALFIDRPRDAARFAAAHALQSLRRALRQRRR